MQHYDLVISIVLYSPSENVLNTVLNTLKKLKHSRFKSKVIIFDNTEASLGQFFLSFKNLSWFEYIHSNKNLGFGSAHNSVIRRYPNSDFYLVLNPDVEFEPEILNTLILRMRKNERISICIPKVLNTDGSIQYVNKLLPTPAYLFVRRFLKKFNFGNSNEQREKYKYKAFSSPYVSGCFLFCRADHINKIDGFDERYFLYLEEIDLCRKVRPLGDIVVFNDVKIVHHWQRGSYSNIKLTISHSLSALKYFFKWGWLFDPDRKRINEEAQGEYYYEC